MAAPGSKRDWESEIQVDFLVWFGLWVFGVFFFFKPEYWKAGGKRDLGRLLGQPVGRTHAVGSKRLKRPGDPGALTVGLSCMPVVLLPPWSVKETRPCLLETENKDAHKSI